MTFNIKFLLFGLIYGQAYAARILVAPFITKSHAFYLNAAVEELAIKGHEVYTIQPAYHSPQKSLLKLGFKVLKYPVQAGCFTFNSKEVKQEQNDVALGLKTLSSLDYVPQALMCECENILEKKFITSLKELHFDIVLVDGFPLVPCPFIIPKLLNIPYIYMSGMLPWFNSRVPVLPSFVPHPILPYTDHMSFTERLIHFTEVILIESEIFNLFGVSANLSRLLNKHLQDPDITWSDIASGSALFFVNRGPLLEWPAPSMPNTFYLEGLTARPASPLSKELNNLVENATSGIVVVSFGSMFEKIPANQMKIFLKTFAQRPEFFFMRQDLTDEENLQIPDNVKIMSWLPQNDLLAHPKAKLFITHCGNNGQYEALYHGIPMIGFPLGGDQQHNGVRIVAHGFGLTGDFASVTAQDLLNKIDTLITDGSFRERTQKAAAILRSKPMNARQEAAYWIEHVLEFGSDHLRSHAMDMPLYQYLMLDILAFIMIVTFIILVILCMIIKRLLRLCFRQKHADKLKLS